MRWLLLSEMKIVAVVSFLVLFPVIHGWGDDGHLIVCRIAQSRLSEAARSDVKGLLPAYADNDLGSLCSWADHIKRQNRQYRWSSPLHYIDTPDNLCNYQYTNYQYTRDCKDGHGEKDRGVVGAIKNYTTQLLTYSSSSTKYNLTEALLFLSHYIGDIHQPLHVGFTSDGGGNAIKVHWYGIDSNLHHYPVGKDAAAMRQHAQTYMHMKAIKMLVLGHTKVFLKAQAQKMTTFSLVYQ